MRAVCVDCPFECLSSSPCSNVRVLMFAQYGITHTTTVLHKSNKLNGYNNTCTRVCVCVCVHREREK